jgi:hypothetical protein
MLLLKLNVKNYKKGFQAETNTNLLLGARFFSGDS